MLVLSLPRGGPGGLIVATPEKANDIVTKLIEEERIGELAVVVVDELHMVQDDHRGGTLVRRMRIMTVPATSFKHISFIPSFVELDDIP